MTDQVNPFERIKQKRRRRTNSSLIDALAAEPQAPATARGDAANSPEQAVVERKAKAKRISMSVPRLKLEVPELPGFKLYWFADRPGRILQAQAGGYEFVSSDEALIHSFSLASDSSESGNSDLGSRISVVSGGERLYLMKIKQEWYEQDQAEAQKIPDRVDEAIRRGALAQDKLTPADRMNTYVRQRYEQTTNPIRRPSHG